MGMSRAQAVALLAAQGDIDPEMVYSRSTASDLARASRPSPNLGYVNVAANALQRLSDEPSSQDNLNNAMARRISAEVDRINGVTPSISTSSGSMSSLGTTGLDTSTLGFGGNSFLSTPPSLGSGASTASSLGTATSGLSGMGDLGTGFLGSGMTAGGLATVGAGLGAAGYGAYNLARNRSKWDDKSEWEYPTRNGAIAGAGIGTMILPGVGTAIGAGLGALGGYAASQFGGGKHKDQRRRDDTRKTLKGMGAIDDAYNLTLDDGSKFDIGRDGSVKNYNVDFSRSGAGDTVGAVNPLAMLVTGGDTEKKRSDLAGYYTNAALSSGDASKNIKKFYSDAGYDHATAYGRVHEMQQKGQISKEAGDQAKNALDQLYGVGAYAKRK